MASSADAKNSALICSVKREIDTAQEKQFIARIKEAIAKSRGYADYFSWPLDRDLEEYCITQIFAESMDFKGQLFFDPDIPC